MGWAKQVPPGALAIFSIYGIFLSKKIADFEKIAVINKGCGEALGYTDSTNRAEPPKERDVPALLDAARFLPLEVSLLGPEENALLPELRELRPSFVLAARWEGRQRLFAVEYKGSSTPKALEAAIQQARRYAQAGPYLPMVIVPYLSPKAMDRLSEERVSGIDLSGNELVIVPGEWLVRSTGAKNRFPAGASIKNVYRGASSLVARVLFARPAFSSVQQILDEIRSRRGKTTLPTVSKALRGLEEDLVVGRGANIQLLQPDRMLDLLRENYRDPVVRRRRRIRVSDRAGSLRKLAHNARESDAYVAGDLPSRYVIFPTSEDMVRVYTSSIEAITRGVELQETSRFPNVELIETDDQTVYFDPDEEEGFPWLSALQTYLMLATGGKREQEAATQIRSDLVGVIESYQSRR